MSDDVKMFEGSQIRSVWDNEREEWYFSVVDVIGSLTESNNPRDYWYRVKKRMSEEERSELSTFCRQLKLKSTDGKSYKTDVADMQGVFRIIQSVPSPKAEPFKMWLAEVGKERIDEIIDPELMIDRALESYARKGYSREWINQRLQAIQVRKELTDTWQDHGVKAGNEYAILTNEISKAWSGMTTREYKDFKGLKTENLRDNMSTTELILNMLAETATKDIAEATDPQGLDENKQVAQDGGSIAGDARKSIEARTGKPVITSKNAIDLGRLISDVVNIVGNIVGEVETIERENKNGEAFKVVNFSVVSKDDERNKTYTNCSAYGDKGDISKEFKQGVFVKLFGQLRTSIDDNGKEHTKNQEEKKESVLGAIKKYKAEEKAKPIEKKESSKETER